MLRVFPQTFSHLATLNLQQNRCLSNSAFAMYNENIFLLGTGEMIGNPIEHILPSKERTSQGIQRSSNNIRIFDFDKLDTFRGDEHLPKLNNTDQYPSFRSGNLSHLFTGRLEVRQCSVEAGSRLRGAMESMFYIFHKSEEFGSRI